MLTAEQMHRACELAEQDFLTNDEALFVLDADASGDDPIDALEEHRFWRSPRGRRQEAADAFESGWGEP